MEVIINIIIPILFVIGSFLSYYIYLINKIKNNAIDSINFAEDDLVAIKKEKMDIAISQTRQLIPKAWRFLFSDTFIENIIQTTFDKMEEYVKKQNK